MIVLITAKAPPQPDGIGDYTARLAETLAALDYPVSVWTSSDHSVAPIPGVVVEQPFSLHRRRGVTGIVRSLEAAAERDRLPEAVVLQFNQFSWGRWGLNPVLPHICKQIKRRWPSITLAVMFHEKVVPPNGWKLRLMRQWQLRQYAALADVSDVRFFSIEKWADAERRRRPERCVNDTLHLPVGSNVPAGAESAARPRAELGIAEDAFVLGSFGSLNPSRLTEWIGAAARRVSTATQGRAVLLHVGSGGEHYRSVCGDVPVIAPGRLPAIDAAGCFPLMDLFLAPFSDGVSTRRGSLMAALAHGVPFATTLGPLSDSLWRDHFAARAAVAVSDGPECYAELVCRLATDLAARREIGRRAQELYEQQFCWPYVARRLAGRLGLATGRDATLNRCAGVAGDERVEPMVSVPKR